MTSCKSSPKIEENSYIVIPPPPAAYDANRQPYVKASKGYVYMPTWKWDEVLEYIAKSQICMEELEDIIMFYRARNSER